LNHSADGSETLAAEAPARAKPRAVLSGNSKPPAQIDVLDNGIIKAAKMMALMVRGLEKNKDSIQKLRISSNSLCEHEL
jgi:hypothetical protein